MPRRRQAPPPPPDQPPPWMIALAQTTVTTLQAATEEADAWPATVARWEREATAWATADDLVDEATAQARLGLSVWEFKTACDLRLVQPREFTRYWQGITRWMRTYYAVPPALSDAERAQIAEATRLTRLQAAERLELSPGQFDRRRKQAGLEPVGVVPTRTGRLAAVYRQAAVDRLLAPPVEIVAWASTEGVLLRPAACAVLKLSADELPSACDLGLIERRWPPAALHPRAPSWPYYAVPATLSEVERTQIAEATLVDHDEAEEYLGVDWRQFYNLRQQGRLTPIRDQGKARYRLSDLQRLRAQLANATERQPTQQS